MWKCPKCGREFKNTNQDHYCVKPENIDEYIAQQPEERRERLNRIRSVIADALPDAREGISWSMPTFRDKRNVIQFASFAKHTGLYPGPEAVEAFAERLEGFQFSKGSIQLPHKKELPEALIADIARWCWENR